MQNLFFLYLAVKWRHWSLFFRETDKKLFQQLSYFISKRLENWHCLCEIDQGDVESVQAKDIYDDSYSEFTESAGISDVYSLILQKKKFSLNQRMIYHLKQLFTSNKQSPTRRSQNKTKTQVTFNAFLNHLYIIQNNLLLLENLVFLKITYRQIH